MMMINFDLSEEDVFPKATLGELISYEDLKESKRQLISVYYNEIDLDKTKYNFSQAFEGNESCMYFERMKTFSKTTINDIMDDPDNHDWHFYRNDLGDGRNSYLKNLLKEVNPKMAKGNPEIYHFALDPDNSTFANRNTGDRNPRIYFMVGYNGTIHPLFFDPYHEINGKR